MGTELETTRAQPPAVRIRETVATIQANVQMVQHVMREVMKPEVHYGKVPGTDKPGLWQPGAEVISLAFHWATTYTTEDLSSPDVVRYRATCGLVSRDTGQLVGEGQGEASSDEEKYRWRKTICQEEFDAAPVDRRRTKYARAKGGGHYTIDQVRQEPADIANTVLKMANKRAFIAAVKTASGCSDMFAQDLEDLPAEVREGMTEEEKPAPPKPLGEKAWDKLVKDAAGFGYTADDVLATAAIAGHEGPGPAMPRDLAVRIFRAMRDNPKVPSEEPEDIEDAEVVDEASGIPEDWASQVADAETEYQDVISTLPAARRKSREQLVARTRAQTMAGERDWGEYIDWLATMAARDQPAGEGQML